MIVKPYQPLSVRLLRRYTGAILTFHISWLITFWPLANPARAGLREPPPSGEPSVDLLCDAANVKHRMW